MDAGFPPKESRGPICLDCSYASDPKACDKVTICGTDEVRVINNVKNKCTTWVDEREVMRLSGLARDKISRRVSERVRA